MTRRLAEGFLPGPVKGGIVAETAVVADCCQRQSFRHQSFGQQKAFQRNVLIQRIACRFFKEVHQVVVADVKSGGNGRNGERIRQVRVNVSDDFPDLFIFFSRLDEAYFFIFHGACQMNEEFEKNRLLQQGGIFSGVRPRLAQSTRSAVQTADFRSLPQDGCRRFRKHCVQVVAGSGVSGEKVGRHVGDDAFIRRCAADEGTMKLTGSDEDDIKRLKRILFAFDFVGCFALKKKRYLVEVMIVAGEVPFRLVAKMEEPQIFRQISRFLYMHAS